MPSYDHPSIGPATGNGTGTFSSLNTPRTPKKSKSSKNVDLSTQNFKVAQQKINLDLDLLNNEINGVTEINLIPNDPYLKSIRLDCRNLIINHIHVSLNNNNNYQKVNYKYNDKLNLNGNESDFFGLYSDNVGIEQHHLIGNKLNYIFNESNTEELHILLPDKFKLSLQDSNQYNNLTPMMRDSPKSSHGDLIYTPIFIKIDYKVKNPKSGVNFIGGLMSDKPKKNWHAYTLNPDYNVSTSSWVPCIDNLWERYSWFIELSIPRTIKDIGNPKIIGTKEALSVLNNDEDDDDFDDNENFEMVVCTGDLSNLKEVPHPIDMSKKLVSWSIINPVCAHHIGWAVGPFNAITLPNLSNEDEEVNEDEKDTNSVPLTIYCLPDQSDSALNSCIFMNKAIDFYSREFGSFPFTSFTMVFVQDCYINNNSFAGLSIMSEKLLYKPDLIEPMFTNTEFFLQSLSNQWSGVNVVPRTFKDLWCTIGISNFMTLQFIKSLMGTNEYKFKIKKQADDIVNEDVGKRPLADQFYRFPLNELDLDFVRLKSPIVLFILDRRMTKTDKSFGLSRVIPKIFLQAMSGDLPNGTLSTSHFQYVCEKVNHNRLDHFFRQWVYSSGVPIFHVTQKFNKKRMFIEMGIKQVQQQETKQLHPNPKDFVNDSLAYLEDEPSYSIQPLFTGPMTIRIHEADGTPYEHIVDLKEGYTKLDIQYNTKYKRLKRSKNDLANNKDDENDETNNILLHCLGDILKTPTEIEEWGLVDWSKEEEETMANEAFEWIRVDADFEWICKIDIKQPDYMFASQLQQDRDVEAQFESIKYFGDKEKPNTLYSSILLKTLMDERYYYGIRVEAARALSNLSREDNNYLGMNHLIKAFRKLFCFENSDITLSNDFSDLNNFFLQKNIPIFLSNIKDNQGNSPPRVKEFLLNLLRYNENINNEFSDCFYIADLIESLVNALSNPLQISLDHLYFDKDSDKSEDVFLNEAIVEINRNQKMDEWIPSYQSGVLRTCLSEKVKLARQGLIKMSFESLLPYTQKKYDADIRIAALEGLFSLGGLKNKAILDYFFKICFFDSSPYLRTRLIDAFINSMSVAAIRGTPSLLDDPEFDTLVKIIDDSFNSNNQTNMVVIEDGSNQELNSRRDTFARATLNGAIELLRRDYSIGSGLKGCLWQFLHSSLLSVYEKRNIFDICQILYDATDSFIVKIPIPNVELKDITKKIVAKHEGEGKVIIRRDGRFKIQLAPLNLKAVRKKSVAEIPSIKPIIKPIIKEKPVFKLSIKNHEPEHKPVEEVVPKPAKETKFKIKLKDPSMNKKEPESVAESKVVPSPKKVVKIATPTKTKPKAKAAFLKPEIPQKVSVVKDMGGTTFNVKIKLTRPVKLVSKPVMKSKIGHVEPLGAANTPLKNPDKLITVDKGTVRIKFSNSPFSTPRAKYVEDMTPKSTPSYKKGNTVIKRSNSEAPLRYFKIFAGGKKLIASSDPFDETKYENIPKRVPSDTPIQNKEDQPEINTTDGPSKADLPLKRSRESSNEQESKSSTPVQSNESDKSKSKSSSPSASFHKPSNSNNSLPLKIPTGPKSFMRKTEKEGSHPPADHSYSSSSSNSNPNSRSSSPFSTRFGVPRDSKKKKHPYIHRDENSRYTDDRRKRPKINIKLKKDSKSPSGLPPPPPPPPPPSFTPPPPSGSAAGPPPKDPRLKFKWK